MALGQQTTAAATARRAVDTELPQRVPVRRPPGRAVHPDEPPGSGDGEVVDAAVTGRRGEDGRPRGAVRGDLDLVRPPERGLPVEGHVVDVVRLAEVHFDPLWIAEAARPPRP